MPRAAATAVALLIPAKPNTTQSHSPHASSEKVHGTYVKTVLRLQTSLRSGVCPGLGLYRDHGRGRGRDPFRDRGLYRGSSRDHGPYGDRGPAIETYFCRDVESSLFSSLHLQTTGSATRLVVNVNCSRIDFPLLIENGVFDSAKCTDNTSFLGIILKKPNKTTHFHPCYAIPYP